MFGEAGFIFLSYGHDSFAPRVERIKSDLTERGYEVWYDKDRLIPGAPWEEYIEEGIERVVAANEKGKFVILMTPHSVRRDRGGKQNGGYCLNELTRALSRQLFIVPVMLDWCEPPLSICRIQWLDMRECFPPEERAEAYKKALDELIRALTTRSLDFDGLTAKLQTTLRPLDFGEFLNRYLSRFIGRQWIFSRLDSWLDDGKGARTTWLTGRPGVGKSAVAAWYTQNREAVGGFHFCRTGQTETIDARRAVQSIAFQLSSQFPAYRDALNLVNFAGLAQADAATLFDNLLVQRLPKESPRSGRPTLVVIDGLDEATENGKNALADLIAVDFKRTPAWLRLLVTSRPESDVKATLQELTPNELSADSDENHADAVAFIHREFTRFAKDGTVPDKTLRELLKRSGGLFLYLEHVLDEVEQGRLSIENVEAFPQGLGGVYDQFFKRRFPVQADYERFLPALETIVAAREPLTSGFLQKLLGFSDYELRNVRASLGSMFVDTTGRFQPFHASVVEWLTNEEKADRFFVSRARGSERLAAASWEGFVGADGVPSPYLTKFLPTHLSETKRQSDLERLLLRYEWIQAKLRLTSVFALGSDYRRLSSDRSGPGRTVGEALELSAAALARNPAELPSQLHGRLRDFQQPEIQRLLTQAASGQNGVWLKPLTTDLTPPGTQLIATITQKGRGITSAVLNHDGSKAIYVNGDDVMMWKPLTGEEPLILCSASSPTLAVSEDGRLLAVSSQDGSVRVGLLCDDGFELQHTFAAVPPQITEISFSNKGASVTVILKDGRVFVLDLGAAKSVRQMPLTLQVQRGPFGSSALAGEIGILLFAASTFAEAIQCWDVNTGRLSRTIPLGTASSKRSIVSKLAVAPQADLFLVGGTDIQIWQRCNGAATLVRTIHGHEYIVSALAVAADRSRIISATSGFMALWDLARSGDTGAWTGRAEAWPKAIDIDTINRRASVIFNTLVAKIYDLDSSNQTSEEPAQPRPVAQATDGRELIGSQKKLVLHTPGSANTQIFQVEFDPSNGSAAFYPDGSCVVIGTEYSVRVFDVASGNITRKLEGDFYYGPTVAVALTNNGLRIAAPLEDNSVGLWDAVATTPVMVLHGHSYSVWSIVFCNGGARLITAGGDATIIIWDLTTGRQEATFTAHAGITCAACTPDNKLIVAGDLAGQVHFLDLMEGSAAELFSRHSP